MSSASPVQSRGHIRRNIVVRRRLPEPIHIDLPQNSELMTEQHSCLDAAKPKDPGFRPKVVVSEKGLNFIQDQKEFVENQLSSTEDPSATGRSEPAKKHTISNCPYDSPRGLFSLQSMADLPYCGTNVGPAAGPTSAVSPRSARDLVSVEHFATTQIEQNCGQEDENMVSVSKLQKFRSGRTVSYLSEDRVRASDKMKARIISLFQSKKSTNDQNQLISPLGHLKIQVKKAFDTERRCPSPSAYITKKVSGIFKVVTREERMNAIKQKLQQVLSGESQAKNQSFEIPSVLHLQQSQNCMKEQIEIQKIQKLQVRRNLSIQRRIRSDTSKAPDQQTRPTLCNEEVAVDRADNSHDLNAEFIQIMEGVKQRVRPKVSLMSFDPDLPHLPLSPVLNVSSQRGKSKCLQVLPQLL